jgi:hypothetical protein
MEGRLDLTVRLTASGRAEVEGEVIDRLGGGNRLAFQIREIDQSNLPATIDELTVIETAFPILGHR